MKKLFYIIALLLLVFQFACKEKTSSIYENCCGTEPTADSVLLDTTGWSQMLISTMPRYGKIYIPNIFIPDTTTNNWFNNVFIVFGGAGLAEIQSAVFSGDNGEVFLSHDYFLPGDVSMGWNGLKPDGSYHYGSFNYTVKARYADGQIKTYIGKACAYKCGDSDFPNDRLPDCFFPTQNNGHGRPDKSQPYNEDCF